MGIGLSLVAVLFGWLYIIPEFQQTWTLYETLKQKKEQVASVQNWESRLTYLQSQQDKLNKYLSRILHTLPENEEMSTIIDHIFSQAQETNVKIMQMKPGTSINEDSHSEIPISITVNGGYHALGMFVNKIESSEYLIEVRQLKVESPGSLSKQLKAKIMLNVILLKRKANNIADENA